MKVFFSLSAALVVSTAVASAATPTKAVAVLVPTKDSTVKGVITFTKELKGVNVQGEVSGLTPGKHGFHIHEFGDCSAPDGASAGSHFNVGGHPHAGPTEPMRHEGDLGNIEAGADGIAKVVTTTLAPLDGDGSLIGRAVIVHAKEDDFKTQPTGNAGGRVACGVIGVAKSQ